MRIKILCGDDERLGRALSEKIKADTGLDAFFEPSSRDDGFVLMVRDSLRDSEALIALKRAILPFDPAVEFSRSDLSPQCDVVLDLGAVARTCGVQVSICCADLDLVERFGSELANSGFSTHLKKARWPRHSKMRIGARVAHPVRRRLLWVLQQHGIVPVIQASHAEDHIVSLILRPAEDKIDATALFPVELRMDGSPERKHAVWANMVRKLPDFMIEAGVKPPEDHFLIELGPLGEARFAAERVAVEAAVVKMMRAERIDPARYPLKTTLGGKPGRPFAPRCVVHLPFERVRLGELRPYAGDSPDRLLIAICSDDYARSAPLATALRAQGFDVTEQLMPEGESAHGFRVEWAMAEACPRQKRRIGEEIYAFVAKLGDVGPAPLEFASSIGDRSSPVVRICLPIRAAMAGAIPDRRGRECALTFYCARPDGWTAQLLKINRLGFKRFKVLSEHPDEDARVAQIRYGGAPVGLIEEIAELLRKEGMPTSIRKAWSDQDKDIWIIAGAHPSDQEEKECPTKVEPEQALPTAVQLDLPKPAVGEQVVTVAFEMSDGMICVGGHRLVLRTDVEPDHPERVAFDKTRFCLDGPSLATLEHLAASVALKQPVLLEGDTSTSKTSSILWLANALNQPVIRMNLNGQTDTGELIGRYVPAEGGGWRWEEGAVPRAMRNGYWLLLDEVNLAEPQILERLNSVLEHSPSLVLSEHDGSRISGSELHTQFRVFATMNPAEFAGRSTLSPAWRDRFGGYRYCTAAGEAEYAAMLSFWVTGVQPAVLRAGAWVRGPAVAPAPYACLEGVAGINDVLPLLARFHMSMVGLSGHGVGATARIGTHRKERHVFTRRTLFNVLEFLAARIKAQGKEHFSLAIELEGAIRRYYLGRLDSPADVLTAQAQVEACGLTCSATTGLQARTDAQRRGTVAALSALQRKKRERERGEAGGDEA